MATKDYSQIVIRLIRDDMKYAKLISGLSNIGFESKEYALSLQQSIFELMDLDNYFNQEELKDWYFQMTERAFSIDSDEMDNLVLEIYSILKTKYHGKN